MNFCFRLAGSIVASLLLFPGFAIADDAYIVQFLEENQPLSPARDSVASEKETQLIQANEVLKYLNGKWRFEFFSEGDSDSPVFVGRRTFKSHRNPLALEWSEEIDGRDIRIDGVFGYDHERNEFYEFGLASIGAGENSIASFDGHGSKLVFVNVRELNQTVPSTTVFRFEEDDTFTVSRMKSDGVVAKQQWTAVFTRL